MKDRVSCVVPRPARRVVRAVFAAAVVAGCGSAWSDIPASAYVQRGLVAQYDGIDNAGTGTHDEAAMTWKDLKGQGGDMPVTGLTSPVWDGKGLSFSAGGIYNSTDTTKFLCTPNTLNLGDAFTIQMFCNSGSSYDCRRWDVVPYNNQYESWSSQSEGFLERINGANRFSLKPWVSDKDIVFTTVVGNKKHRFMIEPIGGTVQSVEGNLASCAVNNRLAFMKTNGSNVPRKDCYSIRIYNRALTADEVAWNTAVDRVRFEEADLSELDAPGAAAGYRYNAATGKIEVFVKLQSTSGTISVDGGDAAESYAGWVEFGSSLEIALNIPAGWSLVEWYGAGDIEAGATPGTYTLSAKFAANLTAAVGTGLCTWTGAAGDGLWTTAGNWSTGATPQEGEVVQLGTGTVTLTEPTPQLAAVEIASTLAMSNWTTCLRAQAVNVAAGGIVKPACHFQDDMMSNRVWIVCKNLSVAVGGKIDANELGYGWHTAATAWATAGQGPGAGGSDGTGGGHGGRGGRGYSYSFGKTYDSIEAPIYAGSSAGGSANKRGTNGGGAIRIEATGEVELHGPVTANARQADTTLIGSGAGGSVYISCRTFRGDALISALGGNSATGNCGGGGGGRISIVYDTEAQAAVSPKPTPTLQADCCRKGFDGIIPSENPNRKATTGKWNYSGDPGTVYLSDASFYPGKIWTECTGYFFVPGLDGSTLEVDSLTLPDEATSDTTKGGHHPILRNLNLVVKGDISLGQRTKLCLSNCTVKAQSVTVASGAYFEMVDHGKADVAGDFTLNGSGAATFCAGATNGVDAAEWNPYGQEIRIGGTLNLQDTSKVYPQCHQTLGGSPHFTLGALSVATGAKINGYGRGWGYVDGTKTGVYGKGPGSPKSSQNGASYGGHGGGGSSALGKTYGQEKNPTDPGSDAGNSSNSTYVGGWGGGIFWADVAGTVTLDGAIAMTGGNTLGREAGGGSGGAVNLRCQKLKGAGTITANGGCGGAGTSWSGNGGGGRVAVYCHNAEDWTGEMTAKAGSNSYTYKYAAEDGTVYFHIIKGLMLMVW